jgi:2-succinyl-5-enolpyruvyl-6-hydroxy-3-cyclohexene-1-carboxylate synthase
MFSSKKNVLQTVALIKAYGIQNIVISPGSRNIPLTYCFNEDDYFNCYSIVDERSAAYFAIGLISKLKEPVIICCTSGTALLNYSPAVAEAFYQELPLVVISADRSQALIGQMDGQTLPQPGVFGSMVKKAVQLPEVTSDEDLWYCNRLVNEALMECTHRNGGPVHINVPVCEPLFDFTEKALPQARKIQLYATNKLSDSGSFCSRWKCFEKRMILLGQMPRNKDLIDLLEKLSQKADCVILCEHLANASSPTFIRNFDAVLSALPQAVASDYAPDLLITVGGHVVSKRIKKFLRDNPPQNHWQIAASGICVDTFKSLTDLVETDGVSFFKELVNAVVTDDISTNNLKNYNQLWKKVTSSILPPDYRLPFSDISVIGAFMRRVPENAALYVGNSSAVRNIQFYPVAPSVEVLCNRGTNGIEGTVSSASGFALFHPERTFLIIGDLSFFYDLNALTNKYISSKLRILLINNGGGGIFHLLPGLEKSDVLEKYIAAGHSMCAEGWVKAAGFKYLFARDSEELERRLPEFVQAKSEQTLFLEVFTSPEMNKSASEIYYQIIKKAINYVNK